MFQQPRQSRCARSSSSPRRRLIDGAFISRSRRALERYIFARSSLLAGVICAVDSPAARSSVSRLQAQALLASQRVLRPLASHCRIWPRAHCLIETPSLASAAQLLGYDKRITTRRVVSSAIAACAPRSAQRHASSRCSAQRMSVSHRAGREEALI